MLTDPPAASLIVTETVMLAHSFWGSGFWTWDGWNFWVATGTISLAAVTGVLAGFTLKAVHESRDAIKLQAREVKAVEDQTAALADQTQAAKDQAAATKRQVEVSVASLEAASRPVLVGLVADLGWRPTRASEALREMIPLKFADGHEGRVFPDQAYYHVSDAMIYCSLPLRNVGAGVAFIQRVELVTSRADTWPLGGRVTDPIVPRDEATRALFAAVRQQSDGKVSDWEEIIGIPGRGYAQFKIRVVYTGASRELITVTELETSEVVSDGSYIYTEQKVWDGEGDERQLLVSTDNIG
jgi:hypothetical protein